VQQDVQEMDAREAVSRGAANSVRWEAARCGPREREELRRRMIMIWMVSRARRNLVRAALDCWEAMVKNVGEKMGRDGRERFGAAALRFGADANLARPVARRVSLAMQEKVVKDPWGSARQVDALLLPLLQNFPVFGGGNGGLLLRGFRERNSFRR